MTIYDWQKQVDGWIRTYGVRYFSELTNMALLTEEVGELSSLMSRVFGDQSFKEPKSLVQAKIEMADEMADILFVLACLANQTGIDLEAAIAKNLEKKSKRDQNRHKNNPKL